MLGSFEFLPRAIEEQRADVVTVPLAQSLDPFDDALRIEIARARTDAERERARVACPVLGRWGGQQSIEEDEWQVVDHFPAQILQRFEHGRLASARHAGDQQDFIGDSINALAPFLASASSPLTGADASC